MLSKEVGYDSAKRAVHIGIYDSSKVKIPSKPAVPQSKPAPAVAPVQGNVSVSKQTVAGVSLNIATVPKDPNLKFSVEKGNNRLVGAEPFSSMIKRTSPLVAVNGNFFDAYRTLAPYGNIMSKGRVIQGIGNDGAFVRTSSGKNIIAQPTVTHSFDTGHGKFSDWYTNAGLNDNTAIAVFNSYYGNSVKLPQGTHFVVTNGKVISTGGGGNVGIPQNDILFSSRPMPLIRRTFLE